MGQGQGPIVILPQRRPRSRPEQRRSEGEGGRDTCKRPRAVNGKDDQPLPLTKKAPDTAPVEEQRRPLQPHQVLQQGPSNEGDTGEAEREHSVRRQLYNVCDPAKVDSAIDALKELGCVVEQNAVLNRVFEEDRAKAADTADASSGGSAARAPAGTSAAAEASAMV